jgi:hypothetical protein
MFYLQFCFKTKWKSILTFNKLTNINQVTLYNLQLAKRFVFKYTPKQYSPWFPRVFKYSPPLWTFMDPSHNEKFILLTYLATLLSNVYMQQYVLLNFYFILEKVIEQAY